MILKLVLEIQKYLNDNKIGQIVREGVQIWIVGPPNVGKSSLINHLSKSDTAIVSDVPGTTRDAISVSLNVNGQTVKLTDTAGLRQSQDLIEQVRWKLWSYFLFKEGVKRSIKAVKMSQAVVVLLSFQDLVKILWILMCYFRSW